jgi:hypothetical protein
MTEPWGFTEAVDRFTSDLDSAVVRARRVAAETRENSEKFRRETGALADRVKTEPNRLKAADLTDDRLRRTATGFRTDHGLAVRQLPDGPELLRRADAAKSAPAPGESGQPQDSVAIANPHRTTGTARRLPPPGDDDEDFSQARIMS